MASQAVTQEWLSNINGELAGGYPEYKFYKGQEILWYDDPEHTYFKLANNGDRLIIPGVTTILKIIDKSFALVPWATKLSVLHIQEKIFNPDMTLKQFTAEEMITWLAEAKDKHKEKLEDAGAIGHIAHSALEVTIQNAIDNTDGVVKKMLNIPELEQSRNCFMAGCEWMRRHNVQWLYTERKIYSREFNFAGTCDGVAYVDSCNDLKCCRGKVFKRRLAVIDWKTSNALRDEYDLQTAAYVFAIVEELGLPISHRFILRLGKTDGVFEPRMLTPEQFEGDFNAFIRAKDLSNDIHSLDHRNRKDKAELKALIKARNAEEKELAKQAERDAKAAIKAEKKAEKEVATQAEKAAKAAAKAAKQETTTKKEVVAETPASVEVSPEPSVAKARQSEIDERAIMWREMGSFSINANAEVTEIEPPDTSFDVQSFVDADRARALKYLEAVAESAEEPEEQPDVAYPLTTKVYAFIQPTGTHVYGRIL